MMIKVSQDILRDDEFRIEIKSNFISNNLGDDLSFKAQYERFKDYKFDIYFNEIHGLYNHKSVSHALFYYTYKLDDENTNRNHFMYQTKLTIFGDDDSITDFDTIDSQSDDSINTIDTQINSYFNSISNIKVMASIETTFYKIISGGFYTDYEDEDEDYESENEEVDYLPPLESPFFQDKCVVCLENKPHILILPCLHICHCITCDEEGLMNKCPMCREKIDRKIEITK